MDERFQIHYEITVSEQDTIEHALETICLEQSVEMPADAISREIREQIAGKVIRVEQIDENGTYEAIVDFPVANTGGEVTMLLNVLFGNISLMPGYKIIDAELEKLPFLPGPSFGIPGVRKKTAIYDRALSCTAIKPLGFSAKEFGNVVYEFALGGLDIIKDDHGLTNQRYAPFEDRLKACVDAVKRAADKTGRRSSYYPNITGAPEVTLRRYEMACKAGADGVLFMPHLTGLEILTRLASQKGPIPLMIHPAFSGSQTIHDDQGFSPPFLYGRLWRSLGADFAIYPNVRGRFSYTGDECISINRACRSSGSRFATVFPTPGGGINRTTIPKWLSLYGPDTVFLISGSLYQHPDGVRAAAEEFRQQLASPEELLWKQSNETEI